MNHWFNNIEFSVIILQVFYIVSRHALYLKSILKFAIQATYKIGFKKSSVSVAMKNLREKNHITVSDAGFINLTQSGREIAEMIYERHEFLSKWLISLGVPAETATEANAAYMAVIWATRLANP